MQDDLLKVLRAREGHFKLESGHHGNLWLDLDRLLVQAGQVRSAALELAERILPYQVAAICGPLVGGAMIAQIIAAELDVEFYYAERLVRARYSDELYPVQYRIPGGLRRNLRNKNVAVVDDVINAGSAVRATIADLQACGAHTLVAGALLVLGSRPPEFLRELNVPLQNLGHLASDLWLPVECPLCSAGVALEDLAG